MFENNDSHKNISCRRCSHNYSVPDDEGICWACFEPISDGVGIRLYEGGLPFHAQCLANPSGKGYYVRLEYSRKKRIFDKERAIARESDIRAAIDKLDETSLNAIVCLMQGLADEKPMEQCLIDCNKYLALHGREPLPPLTALKEDAEKLTWKTQDGEGYTCQS